MNYHTNNNIYTRVNSTMVKCESKKVTQVYFFTAPANTDHVPSTCTCSYRYRGQQCAHLKELPEFLQWEKKPVDDQVELFGVNGLHFEGDVLFA